MDGKRGATGVNAGVMGPGSINIFNNTIVNAYGYFLAGSSNNAGRILFSDNVLFSAASRIPMVAFGANVTSAHNCFFTSGEPLFIYSNEKFSTLNSYKKASGLDADSIFADPQFRRGNPVIPLDFRVGKGSACSSAARLVPLRDRAGASTYDHDREESGAPAIGAFGGTRKAGDIPRMLRSCKARCFGYSFAVSDGVYLVSLRFAPVMLSQPREFSFTVNGRKLVAEFDSRSRDESDDALRRDFIVRPASHWIVLEPDAATDISVVTQVDIRTFDANHGRELQAVAW
jgi:hypothetical protein